MLSVHISEAAAIGKLGSFKVRSQINGKLQNIMDLILVSTHQCHKIIGSWINSIMICLCILDKVKEKPDVPICLIIERIRSQFAYNVSYRKAWKAKQQAIVKVFGDWDKSYEMLPR